MANFWTEHQVRCRLVVDTDGVVIEVVVLTSIKTVSAVIEPLEPLTQGNTIVDLVDQVVDVTEGVALNEVVAFIGVENVSLRDEGQVIGQVVGVDRTVKRSVFTIRLAEATDSRSKQERRSIAQRSLEATEVSATVALETRVPSGNPTVVQLGVVVNLVGRQGTSVRERFSIVEGELAAVEEVTGSGNDFVSDQRKEVTDFDAQVIVSQFDVRLRNRMTVCKAIVPVVIPVIVRDAEGLGIGSIGTVQVIDATARDLVRSFRQQSFRHRTIAVAIERGRRSC